MAAASSVEDRPAAASWRANEKEEAALHMSASADTGESTEMIESIASMTRGRDRHALDRALVHLLATHFDARELSLFRLHGNGVERRAHRSMYWRFGEAFGEPAFPDDDDALLPPGDLERWIGDIEHEKGWAIRAVDGGEQVCCVVLLGMGGETVGWIQVCAARLADDHIRRLLALAAIYGNHLAVIDAGERDTLTGLLNRRSFDAIFGRRLAALAIDGLAGIGERRAREPEGGALRWLAVIDIDHFKRVNDRFGHLYGDEVLVLVARLMRLSLRISDQVFRFGGEEFVVLLAPTPIESAHNVIDRLRTIVESHDFPQIGGVTVSIGYAAVRSDDSPSDAFGRADDALYRAKAAGRNRTERWVEAADDDAGAAPARVMHSDVDLF